MKLNGKKVRLFMARACMKRPDLAKAIGIHENSLGLIFRRGTAATDTIGRMANALGVDVTDILDDDEVL